MKKILAVLAIALSFALVACDNDDYNPSKLDTAITDFISANYTGSKILDAEKEHGGTIKVDILHDGIYKEVYFGNSNQWQYTEWDIRRADIPQSVLDAISSSEYASYIIDDVDFVQTPEKEYYHVELEQGKHQVWLSITAAGEILP